MKIEFSQFAALQPEIIAKAVSDAFPEVSVEKWGVVQPNDTYTDLLEGALPSGTIRVSYHSENLAPYRSSVWRNNFGDGQQS